MSTPQSPALAYASKIECNLETGRTHQIRVHLSENKCGIIGDATYGASTLRRLAGLTSLLTTETLAALNDFTRQALHAVRIAFIHPETSQRMMFEAHYPDDMEALALQLQTKLTLQS